MERILLLCMKTEQEKSRLRRVCQVIIVKETQQRSSQRRDDQTKKKEKTV
jgi:hypothetical protein